jgi:hypothetical protein
MRSPERLSPSCRLILDFSLRVFGLRFAIDRFSHVRLIHNIPASLRYQVLIGAASIAIWDRNKVIVTLAITVWAATIAFHLHSKSLRFAPSGENLKSHPNVIWQQISHG